MSNLSNQHSHSHSVSKFFRVATEGATTDGRVIDRETILNIAKTFNPQTYGARLWLEHIRGVVPESVFKAYGDVVAVKAEEVDTDLGKRMALFAQISPTPDLVALTKARQKIYTSLEINPKFAATGLPYMVGLGITDSPASLGTDILSFAASKGNGSPFAARKHNPDNWYSEAVEVDLEWDDSTTAPEHGKLTTTLKNLFKKRVMSETHQDTRFDELSTAMETVANVVVTQEEKYTQAQRTLAARLESQLATLGQSLAELKNQFTALEHRFNQQDSNPHHRPIATGSSSVSQTDY